MTTSDQEWGERFVRLALAIDEHLPGYVDAYFGLKSGRLRRNEMGNYPCLI